MQPMFVSFTGADDRTSIADMIDLRAKFIGNVEFGILLSPRRLGSERYPSFAWLNNLIKAQRSSGLDLCAHLCGEWADRALEGDTIVELEPYLRHFRRVQFNRRTMDVDQLPDLLQHASAFAKARGLSPVLQWTSTEFPADQSVAYLFDCSRGNGRAPAEWPQPGRFVNATALHGFAGGIHVGNVLDVCATIGECWPNYWLCMESGVRAAVGAITESRDLFDLAKCRQVCERIYVTGRP